MKDNTGSQMLVQRKRINNVVHSDHYPVMLLLDMSFKVCKPQDPAGQLKFFNMTENNTNLFKIFSIHNAFEQQV